MSRQITIKCKDCGGLATSKGPGDWQCCPCQKSYVDQDRWGADRYRVGGNAEVVTPKLEGGE